MNQQDVEQDKINLLFNIDKQFNGLTDSDIKNVLHYVFRYRKQEYIDNNFKKKLNNLDLHFSIQIFDNKNGYISLVDSSILNTMGKKFFDALNLYSNSTNQNLWIEEKKNYESFKKKSYFIENDYLVSQNMLELIF